MRKRLMYGMFRNRKILLFYKKNKASARMSEALFCDTIKVFQLIASSRFGTGAKVFDYLNFPANLPLLTLMLVLDDSFTALQENVPSTSEVVSFVMVTVPVLEL